MNKDELALWKSEINEASRIKKWLIVYDFYSSPTTIGITQKQYDKLNEALSRGVTSGIQLTDGQRLSTNFKVIIKNPEWKDPEELVKKIIFYKYQKDFSERRAKGEDISWEDYASTKKEEAQSISKQLKEAIDND